MDTYRSRYEQREPNYSRINNSDERMQLTEAHGMTYIERSPMNDAVLGTPPRSREELATSTTKYIWAITKNAVPAILEKSDNVKFLESKRATHTNLTGSGVAYCGGEVWFNSGERIYISGNSGRYGVRSALELEDVCSAFIRLGYSVINFGWDDDRNEPHKYFRG